jgi:hypothetical protein
MMCLAYMKSSLTLACCDSIGLYLSRGGCVGRMHRALGVYEAAETASAYSPLNLRGFSAVATAHSPLRYFFALSCFRASF